MGNRNRTSMADEIKEKQRMNPWEASQNRLTTNDVITNRCIFYSKKIREITNLFWPILFYPKKTTKDLAYLNNASEDLKKILYHTPDLPNPSQEKSTMLLEWAIANAKRLLDIYDEKLYKWWLYSNSKDEKKSVKLSWGIETTWDDDIIELTDELTKPEDTIWYPPDHDPDKWTIWEDSEISEKMWLNINNLKD